MNHYFQLLLQQQTVKYLNGNILYRESFLHLILIRPHDSLRSSRALIVVQYQGALTRHRSLREAPAEQPLLLKFRKKENKCIKAKRRGGMQKAGVTGFVVVSRK